MMKRQHFPLSIGLLGFAVLLSACGGTKPSLESPLSGGLSAFIGTGTQNGLTGAQSIGANMHADQLLDFSITPFKLSEVFTVEEHQEDGRPVAWTLSSRKYDDLYLSNDDTMISNENGKSYFSSLPDEAEGYELGDGELLLIPFQWRPSGRWTEDVNYIYNLKTKKGFYLSKPCIGTNGFKQLEGSLVQSEIATTKSVFDEDMENVTFVGYCDLSKYQHGAKKKKINLTTLDSRDFSMVAPQKHYGTSQEEVAPVEQDYYDDQAPGVVKAGESWGDLDRNQEQWEAHLAQSKKKRVCDKLVFEKKMKKKDACEVSSYIDDGRVSYFLGLKANTLKKMERSEEPSGLDSHAEKKLARSEEPSGLDSHEYTEQIYYDFASDAGYILVNGFGVYVDKNNLLHLGDLEGNHGRLIPSSSLKKLYLNLQDTDCIGFHESADYYYEQQEDESDAQYEKRMRDGLNEYMKDRGEDELYRKFYECRLVDNK